tara:strand:- start:1963 stop:2145 length:183 start_codon:yes stop_codon:yes gene_type:complete
MEEVQLELKRAQEELRNLGKVNMMCNEDDYQDNLELSWHKRELEENIKKYKLHIEWLNKN